MLQLVKNISVIVKIILSAIVQVLHTHQSKSIMWFVANHHLCSSFDYRKIKWKEIL